MIKKRRPRTSFFVPETQQIRSLQRFCGLLRVFEFQPFGYSRRYYTSPGANLWNTESVLEDNLMPAQNLRLSDRQLKGVKPVPKDYVLTDGDGFQLRVRSNGSLLWNFNYREPVTKKRINNGFGTYPELSLANARKKAVEARELLAQGIDPKVQHNTLVE
jgi:hypothetical protein